MDESELDLKIDKVNPVSKTDGQVISSLCDRYDIHMFSSEFQKSEIAYRDQQKIRHNEILSDVFNKTKTEETKDAFVQVMQADTENIVKTDYDEKNTQGKEGMFLYLLAGMLLALIILFFYNKIRRAHHAADADTKELSDGFKL